MNEKLERDQKQDNQSKVKSAERVFSIFEYFERVRAPRTLSEISQDLDYPVSSALALLRSVQKMGYLNYDYVSKAYFPTFQFAMLGQWIQDSLLHGGAIERAMDHLAAVTQETVLLGIQNGLNAQHIRVVSTGQSLRYQPAPGTLRPLLRSAGGRVLLCQQPRASVVRVIERINELGVDEGRVFDVSEVLAELENIREAGYAYSANVFTQGAAIVAVPVPVASGATPMTLSLGGPANRVDEAAVPGLVKQIRGVIDEFLQDQGNARK